MALTKIGKEGITGIDNSSDATAITISSDEHVLIGTTTDGTTANGTVIRDAGEVLITRTDNPPLLLNRANTTGVVAEIRQANTAVGYISANSGGMGVYLGGTAAANHLDDYEEGTWTAGFQGATVSATNTTAYYTKIGRQVFFNYYTDAMTISSVSGAALINGLPFTSSGASQSYGLFTYVHGTAVTGSKGGFVSRNATHLTFINDDNTTSASYVSGSNKYVMVAGSYFID